MSDRKYRQRGYQDEPSPRPKNSPGSQGPRPAQEPGAPAGTRRISQDGPKNINMPGYRELFRCAQCGYVVSSEVGGESKCLRCGTDLHSCAQCVSFDPSSRFECMQPVTARVTPKNARNTCASFSPRTTVERETTTPKVDSSRKAFDDLFNF
jgi:hypothetical protein